MQNYFREREVSEIENRPRNCSTIDVIEILCFRYSILASEMESDWNAAVLKNYALLLYMIKFLKAF